MKQEIIPENETGKHVDLFEKVRLETGEEAVRVYTRARRKLFHPATWKPMTGTVAADFKSPFPEQTGGGNPIAAGDYLSIDIPGPGLSAGDGHDWVKVERIEENIDPEADESIAMTVEVCENPGHPEKGIAHFFAEGASSTFIITRKKETVKASYHGRNERPNLENPALGDKIRNTVVAFGAMAGMSALQWKAFLKGLLADSNG